MKTRELGGCSGGFFRLAHLSPRGVERGSSRATWDSRARLSKSFALPGGLFSSAFALSFFLLILPAGAKIITVNTTNNISSGEGETNLVQALSLARDGDTIQFNIPGPGPFFIATPPINPNNGYPPITANNLTIDGYSQPGSLPNTNPILSSNNARIQIVLDSRAGGGTMAVPGLFSLFLIEGAANLTVRGLCFLGPGQQPYNHAMTFAVGAGGAHINGCWIGVDLDGRSVYPFSDGIAGLEYPDGYYVNSMTVGVDQDAPDTLTARGEFNVIVGPYIPILLEGQDQRIAGNFFNVFPNGVSDFNINGSAPHQMEAFIEIGKLGNNVVIGTDGDGNNDAEERNIFGGVTGADDNELIQFYGNGSTNIVIAGNYFGLGVDGITRFTNSIKLSDFNIQNTGMVRIGSDFDGTSDALEGNVIYMNYPFSTLYASPVYQQTPPPPFLNVQPNWWLSLRGNQMVGNNLAPFSYADGSSSQLAAMTNYYATFMQTSQLLPTLSNNSSPARLIGTCSPAVTPYTNVIIDVYLADPEGWTNGQQFDLSELAYIDPLTSQTFYYGFAQGKIYLGSFVKGGPLDASSDPGAFNFDVASLNLSAGNLLTITANYSIDPPGTHNGRTQTSNFSEPLSLSPPTLAISASGSNIVLSWPMAAGAFILQYSASLNPPAWQNFEFQPTVLADGEQYQIVLPMTAAPHFYRLQR